MGVIASDSTNETLSEIDQAKNVAHEGYGHAYYYEQFRKGKNVNPFHKYRIL